MKETSGRQRGVQRKPKTSRDKGRSYTKRQKIRVKLGGHL